MMRVTGTKRKVVVVGGGITGLTTAFYLQQFANKAHLPIEVILIEASLRLGGKIQTLRKEGFIIERGPESFFDSNGAVRQLAEDLKIEHKLMYNNYGQTYVAVGSELYPVPGNFLYGQSPTVSSLITSGIISLSGKIRASGDLIIPKHTATDDEPIAKFFQRRFGKEVVENLVEPLLAGTFAGDIDHLSIKSMFPQIYLLEKKYRSLIVGMKKSKVNLLNSSGCNKGTICYGTFEKGLETLVETLEEQLQQRSTILKGVKVIGIENEDKGKVKLHLNNIPPLIADAVIMTTPSHLSKEIIKKHELLQNLPMSPSATIGTVNMAFKSDQIAKFQDALNFFVSRNSDYTITSCTWSNRKWNNVAKEGYTLLRIYIGRVGDEAIVELSDSEIEKIVLADLEKAIGLKGKPLFTVVTRWKQAMPQYTVGHEERMKQLKKELSKVFPQVHLVGSSYEGISVPDCISQGRNAANIMISNLTNQ